MWKTEYAETELGNLVSRNLMPLVEPDVIFALQGPMGAGKTALTRECLAQLGVDEPVASPTFSYVNEYISDGGLKVCHFDLYRLSSVDDFLALGFEEMLGRRNTVFFIEWPEAISELLDAAAANRRVYRIALAYRAVAEGFRTISCDFW